MTKFFKIFLFLFSCLCLSFAQTNDPLIENRDLSVSPAVDFFHYANGGWFKNNPIPSTESYNGIWQIIRDTINEQVRRICEESANANSPKGTNKQKIGDFYLSGMDTINIEKQGLSPLKDELNRINSLEDSQSLLDEIAHLHSLGVDAGFYLYAGQDEHNSNKYILYLSQGGLGLGDRDYYFNTDEFNKKIRKEYTKHLSAIFRLSGAEGDDSKEIASDIMNLETELASHSRKLEELRDVDKNYNKMSVSELNKLTPSINWNLLLKKFGVIIPDTVVVRQPEFFSAFDKTLGKFSIDEWKEYLKWNLVNTYAEFLNKSIEDQNFYFYYKVMNGVPEQKPRWKRVIEKTNAYLGELIGQVYVTEYIPAGTKEKLIEIGNNVRDVYASHIKNVDWMSEATKEKALKKLSKVKMKMGYPDKWRDLSALEIDRQSYANNVMNVNKWSFNYNINRIGKPVDRDEWGMHPQTYNAYYSSSNNEIVIPACNIIVPGFGNQLPDDAILYGIVGGSTIGHEITHGFDDQGRKFDELGNISNWWTDEDKAKFEAKTKLIVEQFNNYKMLDSMKLNGDATQGENIADLGGVTMGLEAFKKTQQYKDNQIINGLTTTQRYYLAYAYSWQINERPESIAQQIMTDEHAPAQYRVNGPLSNLPEFYEAFNVRPGDPMWRPDSLRVIIW